MKWLISEIDREKMRDDIAKILNDLSIAWTYEGHNSAANGRNKYYYGYYIPRELRRGRRFHFLSLGRRQDEAYLVPRLSKQHRPMFAAWMRNEFPDTGGYIGDTEVLTAREHPGLSFRINPARNDTEDLALAVYIASVQSIDENRKFISEIIEFSYREFRS